MTSTARQARLIPAAAALALAVGAVAGGIPAASAQQDAPRTETAVQTEVSVRGTVKDVDAAERLLVLETATGLRELPVDPGVAGLDGLAAGDKVDVRYQRSVLFDIQPAGSGEPGAYIANTGEVGGEIVTALAEVIEVDGEAGSFTVQGPGGTVRSFHAEAAVHVEEIRRIKVGDMLRVRFRQGVAVAVDKVAAAE